jgi:serine/threonine-protein kinase
MPIAGGTLFESRKTLDEEDLASLLLNIADALGFAHQSDLVHRDISPKNILALGGSGSSGRWVVADWGMVRRPPDLASRVLTRTGEPMGTEGYDAPELGVDAHTATPAVDVYSLGRIAAWFLTNRNPSTGRPLLPDGDMLHWRPFVLECTHEDIHQRVQSMDKLREMLLSVLDDRDEPVEQRAARLVEGLLLRREDNLQALITLAAAYPGNATVFIDHLARIPTSRIRDWTRNSPDRAAQLAQVMAKHLVESPWEDRDFQYVSTPLGFVHTILRALVQQGHVGLAHDIAPSFFTADAHCKHRQQSLRTMEWLEELEGPAERAILRALARASVAIAYYRTLDWTPHNRSLATLLGI